MAKELLNNKKIDYLFSYKLSHDHVELIFSQIRRKNGTCTNPTTLQLKSALKKNMFYRMNVKPSRFANCIAQDETQLWTANRFKKKEAG